MSKPVNIIVYTKKGGVGKSTIASNISMGISLRGKKVELVGVDGQQNEAAYLGINPDAIPHSFLNLLQGMDIEKVRYQARENLYIIKMHKDEAKQSNELVGMQPRIDLYLERKIFNKDSDVDVRIFDCGAHGDKLNEAILNYVDYIIVPVQLEFGSVYGLPLLWDYLSEIYVNTDKILCVVPNMYDARTKESKKYLNMLNESLPEGMLSDYLSINKGISKGQAEGRTIYELTKEDQASKESISKAQREMNSIIDMVVSKIDIK